MLASFTVRANAILGFQDESGKTGIEIGENHKQWANKMILLYRCFQNVVGLGTKYLSLCK